MAVICGEVPVDLVQDGQRGVARAERPASVRAPLDPVACAIEHALGTGGSLAISLDWCVSLSEIRHARIGIATAGFE
jgi:hypothetical protein